MKRLHGEPVAVNRTLRARLMVALATVPPLTCADCGAEVRLERTIPSMRDGQPVDLCAECAVRVLAGGRS